MTLFTEIIAKRLGIIKRPCYNGDNNIRRIAPCNFLITLALGGLRSFTDEGTVADVCLPVLDYLATLD